MCDMCKRKNVLYDDDDEKTKIFNSIKEDVFKRAVRVVIEQDFASIASLVSSLKIGYLQAKKIIDKMEHLRYVTPSFGLKTRKVLITPEQFRKDFGEDYKK